MALLLIVPPRRVLGRVKVSTGLARSRVRTAAVHGSGLQGSTLGHGRASDDPLGWIFDWG